MSICQQSFTSQQAQSIPELHKAEEFAAQSYGMDMQSPMDFGEWRFDLFWIDFLITALCLSLLGTVSSHLKLMGAVRVGHSTAAQRGFYRH